MTTRPGQVVVVGSCNIDLVTRTPHLPVRGETIIGSSFATDLGGKGFNQAVAARRMRARVTMVARVGADDFGTRVLDALRTEGIDTTHTIRDEQQPTGTALITVEEDSGANTIVVVPGANGALTAEDVDQAADTIRGASVLMLQLEVPLTTTLHAARIAHAAGVTVVLTPAPAQPLPDPLLAVTDILLPNEVELTQLQQRGASPAEGAGTLLRRGARAVVVTRGEQGALLVGESGVQEIAPFAVTAVDTVAAGDAFAGALGAVLAEGMPLPMALRYASAAGALAVTQPGALASLPQREAVEALIQQSPNRT